MNAKIFLFYLCVVGGMEAKKTISRELQLIETIRLGELTQKYLDRYQFTVNQLNKPINGKTPLTVAIMNKMDLATRLLIDAGVNVQRQADNTEPLIIAVRDGTVPIVRNLLQKGARLTPEACRLASKRLDMFNFFADTIGKIRLGDYKDDANLLNLSRRDVDMCLENMLLTVLNPKDLQDLLKRGARTDYRDEQGETALDYAVKHCFDRNAKILLSQGSPPAKKSNIKQLRMKCEQTITGMPNDCCKTFNVVINTKSDDLVYQQFIDLVKDNKLSSEFLERYFAGLNRLDINRTFIDRNNENALVLAVRFCHFKTTKLLLEYGASTVQYAFAIALKECPKKMLRLLMDHGAKLHSIVRPLELIIQYNPDSESIITWLVPIVSYHDRQQALLFACLKAKKGIVKILLDHGVNINDEGEYGQTPLWNAMLSQDLEMVQFVLDHGSRIKLTNEQLQYMKKFFPAAYNLVA